ncbi:MAG: serine/threonine-protein kinase [Planctomycetota bacterium]
MSNSEVTASEIFARVIEVTESDERSRLIRELCGDHADLEQRITAMVAAHDSPDSFFDSPVTLTEDERTRTRASLAGRIVGPYKLLQEIGEGGMGLVFMAEQQSPVKRRVALKVIKPGMNSERVLARFEAERQALAMMDHPNIAKVYDAGSTDEGYPFFVMELVNGSPIHQYCDQEQLSTRRRLELFSDVCRALQHSHQKGVIHRDLKPSNILVAEYDGRPIPKVIDFGVAKATGVQLTDRTLFTEFGQVVGTIEYMSPEQSRRNQLDVDTRSDIYSLGIVLYKLLTGETPFGADRLRHAAWDEVFRIIREEDPVLPSVKVSSSGTINQLAKNRNVEPGRLSAQIRGDLDWIVQKSLEKDRNRRYRSAGEFADDVQRHLDEMPVEAAPRGFLNRSTKWARRNRGMLRIASLILMIAFALGALFVRERQQRLKASARVLLAVEDAKRALSQAKQAPLNDRSTWEVAEAQKDRLRRLMEEFAGVNPRNRSTAKAILDELRGAIAKHRIRLLIEDVVLHGASNQTLESWQLMELEIKQLFARHGLDLERQSPEEIGNSIREDRLAVEWSDLLELWIGTVANLGSFGGRVVTPEELKPWVKARDCRSRSGSNQHPQVHQQPASQSREPCFFRGHRRTGVVVSADALLVRKLLRYRR